MPLPQINTRLAEYLLIHKGKRFGGFDECLEQEENRTLAEDLSISVRATLPLQLLVHLRTIFT